MAITDELTGTLPTWRMTEEPIYLAMVAEFGSPWLEEMPNGQLVLVAE